MSVASSWYLKGSILLLLSLILSMNCYAMDAPEAVTIDSLAQYYDAVEFDHAMHVDLAEGCSSCHHRTSGTGTIDLRCAKCHNQAQEMAKVSCQDCHVAEPFSAAAIHRQSQEDLYHVDIIGLTGAYHRNCLGCHQVMDGPVGCEDCHAKTEAGEKFYYSGEFAPAPSAHTSAGH